MRQAGIRADGDTSFCGFDQPSISQVSHSSSEPQNLSSEHKHFCKQNNIRFMVNFRNTRQKKVRITDYQAQWDPFKEQYKEETENKKYEDLEEIVKEIHKKLKNAAYFQEKGSK